MNKQQAMKIDKTMVGPRLFCEYCGKKRVLSPCCLCQFEGKQIVEYCRGCKADPADFAVCEIEREICRAIAKEKFFSEIDRLIVKKVSCANLSKYRLGKFPTEMSSFAELEKLAFDYNDLKMLPTEIGKFTSLTKLELAGNLLSELPAEIGKLTSLRHLDLSFNLLKSLPKEIGKLASLDMLILRGNKLKKLPEEISELNSLSTLLIYDNFICQSEIEKLKIMLPKCEVVSEDPCE